MFSCIILCVLCLRGGMGTQKRKLIHKRWPDEALLLQLVPPQIWSVSSHKGETEAALLAMANYPVYCRASLLQQRSFFMTDTGLWELRAGRGHGLKKLIIFTILE